MSWNQVAGRVRLSDAPVFTVLRRLKNVHHESRAFIFWGGCYIPGRVGDVPHAVCFDMFGSPVYARLNEWVLAYETGKRLQDRYRTWYWATNTVEPAIWMKVREAPTNPLLLAIQSMRAKRTSGLIPVARKRAA